MKASILTIGDELLIAETQDTNSFWLCQQLTYAGLTVTRITILSDRIEEIQQELQAARARGVELVFTLGGLGPTDDDLTLQAVARTFSLQCELDQQALAWVSSRQKELVEKGFIDSLEMTPERLKMASIPVSSIPLHNSVGTAPGVLLELDGFRVVSLPGVPAEMQAIFLEQVQPLLKKWVPGGGFGVVDFWVGCGDESVLAPLLRTLTGEYPTVYTKSKAKGYGSERRFNIKLHARGTVSSAALLESAADRLEQLLAAEGIPIISRCSKTTFS